MVKIPPWLAKYPEFSEESIAKADRELNIIMLIRGKRDDGVTPFYAYIKVIPSKALWIKDCIKSGKSQDFRIEELEEKEIIKIGDTANPPFDVVNEMREKWNFDENFSEKATKELKEFIDKKQTERLIAKIAEMKKKKKQ